MNTLARASRKQFTVTFIILLCLLCAPITALARRGERNYRRGLQHEAAQRWDQAVQEFALAVAANPSDTEYMLHYRRAVFNASQQFMQQGRALAERGDYPGAYNAFRQSFAYDPNNELAASEMQRMMRLHREATGTAMTTPASFNGAAATTQGSGSRRSAPQEDTLPPARSEVRTQITYASIELDRVVSGLARQLDLNVVFDRDLQAQASQRRITLDLDNVTIAEALDHVFVSQNLFFQRLSRRTILVADQSKRPQYQQLVLRTFYLQNADPAKVRELVLGVIPATAGRQIVIVPNIQTNSVTVRDTPENIRVIGELIESIDKDRAAVVMDVSIYEVSRTDLQQLGLQIGTVGNESTPSTLLNIGGSTGVGIGGATNGLAGIPNALGVGLIIPQVTLSALQRNDRTRLVYRSQVHAFDGEQTQLRSGQRVPFQSGVIPTYGTNNPTQPNTPPANNQFFSGGYPIITQEPTGLTLEFTPTVFPNLDVQVKMRIQSREVFNPGTTLTPTFTEREITGSARVQNNQTLMLASVSQDRQSNGRVGLPLLGLIPILGRLFSTPRRDNFNADIVIAVTPRVLRAPDISPRDEQLRPTGTQQTPTTDSLALLMRQIDREEQLASAPATRSAQPSLAPATVNTTPSTVRALSNPPPARSAAVGTLSGAVVVNTGAVAVLPVISESAPSFIPAPRALMQNSLRENSATNGITSGTTSGTGVIAPSAVMTNASSVSPSVAANSAELRLMSDQPRLRVGERRRLMVWLRTDTPLSLMVANLRFDPRIVAVRSVVTGDMFQTRNEATMPALSSLTDASGLLLVSLAPPIGAPIGGAGVFLIVEVEGLAPGTTSIAFIPEGVHLMAADGRTLRTAFAQSEMTVTQ